MKSRFINVTMIQKHNVSSSPVEAGFRETVKSVEQIHERRKTMKAEGRGRRENLERKNLSFDLAWPSAAHMLDPESRVVPVFFLFPYSSIGKDREEEAEFLRAKPT